MPQYHFAVDGLPDETASPGVELADDKAAWEQATRFAGELLKDIDGHLKPGQDWHVEVTNERRELLYSIEIKTHQS